MTDKERQALIDYLHRNLPEILDRARKTASNNCEHIPYIESLSIEQLVDHPDASYWGCWYARYVLQDRWPEIEPLLSTNPWGAVEYARYIIRGRWPEAEPVVLTGPQSAVDYARYVVRGCWPEAESIIMRHPESAFVYSRYVLKDRWIEAEPVVMTKPWLAAMYAVYTLKKRWPEAEPIIAFDENAQDWYLSRIRPSRKIRSEADPTTRPEFRA